MEQEMCCVYSFKKISEDNSIIISFQKKNSTKKYTCSMLFRGAPNLTWWRLFGIPKCYFEEVPTKLRKNNDGSKGLTWKANF